MVTQLVEVDCLKTCEEPGALSVSLQQAGCVIISHHFPLIAMGRLEDHPRSAGSPTIPPSPAGSVASGSAS